MASSNHPGFSWMRKGEKEKESSDEQKRPLEAEKEPETGGARYVK